MILKQGTWGLKGKILDKFENYFSKSASLCSKGYQAILLLLDYQRNWNYIHLKYDNQLHFYLKVKLLEKWIRKLKFNKT